QGIRAPVARPPALRYREATQAWDEPPPSQPYWRQPPEPPRRAARPGPGPPDGRPRASAAMLGVGAVLVVVLVGIGLWFLGHRNSQSQGGGQPSHSASSSAANSVTPLAPVSAG